MKIILDCNIWISFLIGHQISFVRQLLNDARFQVYACERLLEEIQDVCSREKIKKYIRTEDVADLLNIIYDYCQFAIIGENTQSPIRDPKDLYLLTLAETIDAIYIVSGDKDLLDLKQHKQTRIIKLADFRQML
ncbi:putative toxin-antitoxin system toxin component, PIN family [Fibrobacter sp. UBA4297]|uniref:putative toxin-antitoxin system toxin component, PIN family n=1 Tax=Fibrobacter sp. UBA4297 TaxID=1946536 RepID=UPI0025BC0FAB|nr:putative toxin-antitoxin system toxin component, PIN family [Fibrobacter sp. UBA4297]